MNILLSNVAVLDEELPDLQMSDRKIVEALGRRSNVDDRDRVRVGEKEKHVVDPGTSMLRSQDQRPR